MPSSGFGFTDKMNHVHGLYVGIKFDFLNSFKHSFLYICSIADFYLFETKKNVALKMLLPKI